MASLGTIITTGAERTIAIDSTARSEFSTRAFAELSVGVELRSGPLWSRFLLIGGRTLNGRILWKTRDEAPRASTYFTGLDASVGGTFRGVDIGIAIGPRFPSRLLIRGLADIRITPNFSVEPSLGLTTRPAGEQEAAFGLQLRIRL